MPHYAAFHLGLHCLPKYMYTVPVAGFNNDNPTKTEAEIKWTMMQEVQAFGGMQPSSLLSYRD